MWYQNELLLFVNGTASVYCEVGTVFKNSSDEFQCSDCLVTMYSRVQPAGTYAVYTGTGYISNTVSEAVTVPIFRDVTLPGRPECRQQVPPSLWYPQS